MNWAIFLLGLGLPFGGLMFPSLLAENWVPVFEETFRGKLQDGWKWARENKAAWKITSAGLEVRVEPGNLWGAANDAKNVLLFPIPEALHSQAMIVAEIAHEPKKRWEQANLAWYFSDSAMVKLGLEIEDGRINIVMGREENDRTKTVAIIPFASGSAELQLIVKDGEITGNYRRPGAKEWRHAGTTTVPAAPPNAKPQLSLQFYQGEEGSDRWAVVKRVQISRPSP